MNGSVPFELVQHVTVFVIALAAAAVVLRKVLGVFERRPAGSAAGASRSTNDRGVVTASANASSTARSMNHCPPSRCPCNRPSRR